MCPIDSGVQKDEYVNCIYQRWFRCPNYISISLAQVHSLATSVNFPYCQLWIHTHMNICIWKYIIPLLLMIPLLLSECCNCIMRNMVGSGDFIWLNWGKGIVRDHTSLKGKWPHYFSVNILMFLACGVTFSISIDFCHLKSRKSPEIKHVWLTSDLISSEILRIQS